LWGIVFILSLACLISVISVAVRSGQELRDAMGKATHTREVLEKLTVISGQLSEMESAARSFAISGKQSHLSPFYTAA
jgi:CHASE3 domain sensor protein